MNDDKISVILLESNKLPRVTDLDHSLEGSQQIVKVYIEAFYPFEEEVCIVCNEEGKLEGLPANRALYDSDHQMYDIICGPAFICDCSGESFGSLSEEQIKRYGKQFQQPERFFRTEDGIVAIPFTPAREQTR